MAIAQIYSIFSHTLTHTHTLTTQIVVVFYIICQYFEYNLIQSTRHRDFFLEAKETGKHM